MLFLFTSHFVLRRTSLIRSPRCSNTHPAVLTLRTAATSSIENPRSYVLSREDPLQRYVEPFYICFVILCFMLNYFAFMIDIIFVYALRPYRLFCAQLCSIRTFYVYVCMLSMPHMPYTRPCYLRCSYLLPLLLTLLLRFIFHFPHTI